MENVLERCREQQTPAEIIYLSEKGEISQRIIVVNELNRTYCRAYCTSKHAVRTFKLKNILSCRPYNGKARNRSFAQAR